MMVSQSQAHLFKQIATTRLPSSNRKFVETDLFVDLLCACSNVMQGAVKAQASIACRRTSSLYNSIIDGGTS